MCDSCGISGGIKQECNCTIFENKRWGTMTKGGQAVRARDWSVETAMISGGASNGDQVWPRVTHDSDPSDLDLWETWIHKTRIRLSQVCTGFPRVTHMGYPWVLGLVDSFVQHTDIISEKGNNCVGMSHGLRARWSGEGIFPYWDAQVHHAWQQSYGTYMGYLHACWAGLYHQYMQQTWGSTTWTN